MIGLLHSAFPNTTVGFPQQHDAKGQGDTAFRFHCIWHDFVELYNPHSEGIWFCLVVTVPKVIIFIIAIYSILFKFIHKEPVHIQFHVLSLEYSKQF